MKTKVAVTLIKVKNGVQGNIINISDTEGIDKQVVGDDDDNEENENSGGSLSSQRSGERMAGGQRSQMREFFLPVQHLEQSMKALHLATNGDPGTSQIEQVCEFTLCNVMM